MAEQNMNDIDCLNDLQTADIKGKVHPTADGLVSRAHRDSTDRGLYITGNKVDLLDPPRAENDMTAIVKHTTSWRSIVADEEGGFQEYVFEEIGDANVGNCNQQIGPHFIRMASTRAMSRCISLALNISFAAAEELLESGGVPSTPAQAAQRSQSNSGGAEDLGGWNGQLWYGSDKGKHYTDTSITVKTLQWGADKTNNDKQKQALLNEIARRDGGGGGAAPAPSSSAPSAGGGNNSNWKADAKMVGELVKLGQAAGVNFPQIKAMAAENFEGQSEPAKLTKDQFSLLRVLLGGEELA